MPVAANGDTLAEEKGFDGWLGKSQMTMAGASSEIWFCEAVCAGTAGVGCGSDTGFAMQQAIWLHASALTNGLP
jgi:hypothetical protein